MPVEMQRNMFDKLSTLDFAVHDLVVSNLQLKSQLEESRRSAEICVGAAATQFGAELRLREAAHEQALKAVVARYTNKGETKTLELGKIGQRKEKSSAQEPPTETFAQVVREARPVSSKAERKVDRSLSRSTHRNKALKEARKVEHIPAFVIGSCGGKPPKEVRDIVWKKVAMQSIQPKCRTVTTKDGRIIIKSENRETADVLKSLAGTSKLIKEDSARWPRVLLRVVMSDARPEKLQRSILTQNSHLDIDGETEDTVLNPIFKRGKRDMDTTNWVLEVNPKYFNKFEDTTVYVGFMR